MPNGSPLRRLDTTLFLAIAMTVTMLVGTFPEYALGTVVPFTDGEGPLNAHTVGIYTSAMFASAVAVSMLMGRVVDRYPAVPLSVFLFISVSCVMVSLPSLDSNGDFLLFSIVAGGFLALSNPLTNRIIRVHVPLNRRPWVIGWKSVGPQLGAVMAGLVYALGGSNWQETSYGAAIVFIVLAVLFGFGLGRVLGPTRPSDNLPPVAESRPGTLISPVVYWLVPFSFFTGGAISTVGAYVPVFAHDVLAFQPGKAGLAAAVVAVASITGRAIWIGACRWVAATQLLIVACLLAAVSALGLVAAPLAPEWVFWLSLVATGVTAMGMAPLVQVIVIEETHLSRIGHSSALVGMGLYAGFAVQPIFMGEIMQVVGFANSWAVVSVSNLLGVVVLGFYSWNRIERETGPDTGEAAFADERAIPTTESTRQG